MNPDIRNKISINNMKKIFLLVPFVLFFFPTKVQAQQVNNYNVCRQYREEYRPGGYDSYGNYVQGGVVTRAYNVPCNNSYGYNNGYNHNYQNNGQSNSSISCDPTRAILGGLLGGGIAAGLSRGDGYAWSVPLGAALGGAAAGCIN
jgi:hypothetical protein